MEWGVGGEEFSPHIHPRMNPEMNIKKKKKKQKPISTLKVAGGKEHKHTRDTSGGFDGPKILPG